jgi:hypothetical protein
MSITFSPAPGPMVAPPRTPEQIRQAKEDKRIYDELAKPENGGYTKDSIEKIVKDGDPAAALKLKKAYEDAGGKDSDMDRFLSSHYSPNVSTGIKDILHHQHNKKACESKPKTQSDL